MTRKAIIRRKRVRLADVAREAGTSPGTASMALSGSPRISDATRQRVLAACSKLDYQPPRTRQLARQSAYEATRRQAVGQSPGHQASQVAHLSSEQQAQDGELRIGLMCIGGRAADTPNSELFHYLTRLSQQYHVRIEVASVEQAAAEKLVDQVLAFARPCDGLLLTGVVSAKLLRLLDESGIRAGSMDLPLQDDPDYANEPCRGVCFVTDDRAMAAKATEVLLERGHRHIAFISQSLRVNQSQQRLYEGHCLAMLNAGHMPDRQMLGLAGAYRDEPRKLAQRLKQLKHPPTAAVLLDVMIANPLLYELQAAGLSIAPKDLVIWGIEDSARRNGLFDSLMMSADIKRWAEAGLRYAMSPAGNSVPLGSQVNVPFVLSPCPAVDAHDAASTNQAQAANMLQAMATTTTATTTTTTTDDHDENDVM